MPNLHVNLCVRFLTCWNVNGIVTFTYVPMYIIRLFRKCTFSYELMIVISIRKPSKQDVRSGIQREFESFGLMVKTFLLLYFDILYFQLFSDY